VFERKVLRKSLSKDDQSEEWRKRHNQELHDFFTCLTLRNKFQLEVKMDRTWTWRKQGSITRTVVESNPSRKRPLIRPRLRWEDCVIKDVERIEAGIQWIEDAEDRDRWRKIYLEGWS